MPNSVFSQCLIPLKSGRVYCRAKSFKSQSAACNAKKSFPKVSILKGNMEKKGKFCSLPSFSNFKSWVLHDGHEAHCVHTGEGSTFSRLKVRLSIRSPRKAVNNPQGKGYEMASLRRCSGQCSSGENERTALSLKRSSPTLPACCGEDLFLGTSSVLFLFTLGAGYVNNSQRALQGTALICSKDLFLVLFWDRKNLFAKYTLISLFSFIMEMLKS